MRKTDEKSFPHWIETKRGFEKLNSEDPELAEVARGFVLVYQHGWKGKNEDKLEVLQEVLNFAGFKIEIIPTIKRGKINWRYSLRGHIPTGSVQLHYNLFERFKSELKAIEIIDDDVNGIFDECVVVANLISKYRNILDIHAKKAKQKFEKKKKVLESGNFLSKAYYNIFK